MKRTKIFAMITAMTIAMGSLAACGNGEYIESMSTDEIVEDNAVVEDEAVTEDTKSNKTESNKTESNKTESNKSESNKTESNKAESNKTESNKTESNKTESTKTESAKTESTETMPNGTTTNTTVSADTAPAQTTQPAQTTKPAQTTQPTPAPVHEHNWVAHTDQRWVPQIVTVVDEPERYEEYTVFKIYWYNTGTWEETRDPDRFREWSYSEYGSLYPFYHIENIEDNPLFLGYNELGQPSFIGDHVLWSGYDFIPAITHEEDQGYYETYVDYYYCDCGATK